jgi:hypothetical protein
VSPNICQLFPRQLAYKDKSGREFCGRFQQ